MARHWFSYLVFALGLTALATARAETVHADTGNFIDFALVGSGDDMESSIPTDTVAMDGGARSQDRSHCGHS